MHIFLQYFVLIVAFLYNYLILLMILLFLLQHLITLPILYIHLNEPNLYMLFPRLLHCLLALLFPFLNKRMMVILHLPLLLLVLFYPELLHIVNNSPKTYQLFHQFVLFLLWLPLLFLSLLAYLFLHIQFFHLMFLLLSILFQIFHYYFLLLLRSHLFLLCLQF